jgi:hypothetical protein
MAVPSHFELDGSGRLESPYGQGRRWWESDAALRTSGTTAYDRHRLRAGILDRAHLVVMGGSRFSHLIELHLAPLNGCAARLTNHCPLIEKPSVSACGAGWALPTQDALAALLAASISGVLRRRRWAICASSRARLRHRRLVDRAEHPLVPVRLG